LLPFLMVRSASLRVSNHGPLGSPFETPLRGSSG
jgi:hypothetical protein